jgi:RNA polymerase sigma-70 factor (ECF subfamily)
MIDPDHARFAEWDAAYVLGALSPAERRDFEEHLDGCDKCRAAVSELSAMPGLLGRIDDARAFALLEQAGDDAEGSDAATPLAGPPADLVARIQNRARTDRIRRRVGTGAALAAAAAIAAVLALVLPPVLTPAVQPAFAASLTPTDASVPVKADIELTSLAWGTRIDMDCTYHPAAPGPNGGYGPVEYAMWVVDRNGTESPLSTWTAAPNGTVSVTAGTALALADIAEVEVRTASGDQVLLTAELDAS